LQAPAPPAWASLIKRPANLLKRPANLLKRPANLLKRPANLLKRPANLLKRPANLLKRPANLPKSKETHEPRCVAQVKVAQRASGLIFSQLIFSQLIRYEMCRTGQGCAAREWPQYGAQLRARDTNNKAVIPAELRPHTHQQVAHCPSFWHVPGGVGRLSR
jgi:hypothetical protein